MHTSSLYIGWSNFCLCYPINPFTSGDQDTLGEGGSSPPPPSKSHVSYQNMTNDTSLESYYAQLLESVKKNVKKMIKKIHF